MFTSLQTNVVTKFKYKVASFLAIVHYMAHQIT
jgi:hypothetical protein